MPKMRV